MKRSSLIALVFVSFAAACDPGEFFGPDMATVPLVGTSRIPEHRITLYVNGSPLDPKLTKELLSHPYEVEVRVREQRNCSGSYYCPPRQGTIRVSAFDENLGEHGTMSRVIDVHVTTEQPASVVVELQSGRLVIFGSSASFDEKAPNPFIALQP